MKFRTRTFLKAALVAVALEAGALGVTNVANAFTLIELLDVTHSAMDFSSVSVNPDIHTPQVNVANVGEEAIKVQVVFHEYDEDGAPFTRAGVVHYLEPGHALQEAFPSDKDTRSLNFTRHIRPVVLAVTESGEPAQDLTATFELVGDGSTQGLLLPAVQKVREASARTK